MFTGKRYIFCSIISVLFYSSRSKYKQWNNSILCKLYLKDHVKIKLIPGIKSLYLPGLSGLLTLNCGLSIAVTQWDSKLFGGQGRGFKIIAVFLCFLTSRLEPYSCCLSHSSTLITSFLLWHSHFTTFWKVFSCFRRKILKSVGSGYILYENKRPCASCGRSWCTVWSQHL